MKLWPGAACLLAISCSATPGPAPLSRDQDSCAQCRMVIVSQSTAAQVVSPGEEPRFFDEIGCLRDYLSNRLTPPTVGTVIYVADHRTGAWIEANRAVFMRTATSTPMGSGFLAHADITSRDADPAARDGTPLSSRDILQRVSRADTP